MIGIFHRFMAPRVRETGIQIGAFISVSVCRIPIASAMGTLPREAIPN